MALQLPRPQLSRIDADGSNEEAREPHGHHASEARPATSSYPTRQSF